MSAGKKTIKTTGLDELIQKLETMTPNTEIICEDVAYEGINVIADEMKSQLNSIKTTSDESYSTSTRNAYAWEKEALVDGMGISPVRNDNGLIDYKVGFDGYVDRNGTKKAVALIANSINAGTSFMPAQPFVKKTVSAGRKAAIAAMEAALSEQIDKYMK